MNKIDKEKDIEEMLENLLKEQEMTKEKIEELKKLIQEGNYNIPVEEVVEKMLEKFRKNKKP